MKKEKKEQIVGDLIYIQEALIDNGLTIYAEDLGEIIQEIQKYSKQENWTC